LNKYTVFPFDSSLSLAQLIHSMPWKALNTSFVICCSTGYGGRHVWLLARPNTKRVCINSSIHKRTQNSPPSRRCLMPDARANWRDKYLMTADCYIIGGETARPPCFGITDFLPFPVHRVWVNLFSGEYFTIQHPLQVRHFRRGYHIRKIRSNLSRVALETRCNVW